MECKVAVGEVTEKHLREHQFNYYLLNSLSQLIKKAQLQKIKRSDLMYAVWIDLNYSSCLRFKEEFQSQKPHNTQSRIYLDNFMPTEWKVKYEQKGNFSAK